MKQKVVALFSALVLLFIPAGYGKAGGQSSMYAQAENWAYLETDKTAAADVFFICPTVYGGETDRFNMSMDDKEHAI